MNREAWRNRQLSAPSRPRKWCPPALLTLPSPPSNRPSPHHALIVKLDLCHRGPRRLQQQEEENGGEANEGGACASGRAGWRALHRGRLGPPQTPSSSAPARLHHVRVVLVQRQRVPHKVNRLLIWRRWFGGVEERQTAASGSRRRQHRTPPEAALQQHEISMRSSAAHLHVQPKLRVQLVHRHAAQVPGAPRLRGRRGAEEHEGTGDVSGRRAEKCSGSRSKAETATSRSKQAIQQQPARRGAAPRGRARCTAGSTTGTWRRAASQTGP